MAKIRNKKERDNNQKLAEKYLNVARVIIVALDKKGMVTFINKRGREILGCRREDLIGRNWFDNYLLQGERQQIKKVFKAIMAGHVKQLTHYENSIIGKNKEIKQISWYNTILKEGNKIVGTLSSGIDITDKKISEAKLRESEEKFKSIIYNVPGMVYIAMPDWSAEIISGSEEICGYTPKDFSSKKINWLDLVHPEDKKRVLAEGLKLNKKAKNLIQEYRIVDKDKSVRWVIDRKTSHFDNKGRFKIIYGVVHDITEEKKLEQAKIDFLSLASHQLRTPLSATRWVLETLASDKNLTPKQRERSEDLITSNERLINLVNDLLDVTRIESGKLVVNKKMVNLRDLVNKLLVSLETLAREKKKNIKVIISPEIEDVYFDSALLYETLENLLSNALIYGTETSPEISLVVSPRAKDCLVAVHNEGVVDKAIANDKIFEKFIRGSNSSDCQPSGSGLGLYIAKRVIEANGGAIWFESNPKSGTTFYFTIIKDKIKR